MFQTHLEMGEPAKPDNAARIRIVIVEKHAAVRRALCKRLNAAPDLDVIATVQEPIAVLPYLKPPGESTGCIDTPDIVLLSLRDGSSEAIFVTIEIIRQIVNTSTGVIVLTPFADEVERLLLQQAGVSSYLLKNIDSLLLIQEIEAIARRGRHPVAGI